MKTKLFLTACALACAGSLTQAAEITPASAPTAGPVLSGTYLVHIVTVCGLAANPWPDGVTSQFDGSYEVAIGTIQFFSTNHTANFNGTDTFTQLIVPNSKGGNTGQNPSAFSGAYTNTATALTLNGENFQAVYGKLMKGVAQDVEFVGTSTSSGLTSANCVEHGQASLIAS
jgi:hypothetical protein